MLARQPDENRAVTRNDRIPNGGWRINDPYRALLGCAAGITLERLWSLRPQEVNPRDRLIAMQQKVELGDITDDWLDEMLVRSPLKRLGAQVLQVRHGGKSAMQDLLFVEVKQVAHELERYLSTLGSMAAITPLLGLLGTVIGMIKVFSAIQAAGLGEASLLAGGISEALVTTAAGLGVAIPALVMHRFLSRRVDELLIDIEHHISGLIDHCAAQSVHPK